MYLGAFMKGIGLGFSLVVATLISGCSEPQEEVSCGYVPVTGIGGEYQKKHDARAQLAQKNSLCGVVYEGVTEFVSALYESPQKTSKEYVNVALYNGFDENQWGGEMIDGFRAIQVLDDYVLYNFDPYETKSCQDENVCQSDSIPAGAKLLVQKQLGEMYLVGQKLPIDNFMVYKGITEYKNLAGSTEQAITFSEVSALGSCTALMFGKDNCAGLPN